MPKSAFDPVSEPLGRRETGKREKLLRIRQAAKDVFLQKGFEAATVREIAAAADVAFGTLFLYANDKQDLLLLLFDEELPVLSDRALQKAKVDAPFVDQLVLFFGEFFAFFSATPKLSQDMLREITFGTGIVAKRIWEGVQGTEQKLARLVAKAQADGRVSSGIAPQLAAHVIFSLYRVEIRFCLNNPEPDVSGSLANLRRQFDMVLTGLEAHIPQDAGAGVSVLPPRRPRRLG